MQTQSRGKNEMKGPSMFDEMTHRRVQSNGIPMHIAEAGEGPSSSCCMGFPNCGTPDGIYRVPCSSLVFALLPLLGSWG
jgi:hypothetical protein